MLPGVYQAVKKDGTIYYRSSITYQGKHISLGSYSTEEEAHRASVDASVPASVVASAFAASSAVISSVDASSAITASGANL